MAHPTTAFVSFRSPNIELVRRIFARLVQQGLEPWNYELSQEGIAVSQDILTQLEQQVRRVDCFIPIITKESMAEESRYTRFELECALRRQREEPNYRILPIVCGAVPDVWPEPFKALRQIKYTKVDQTSLAALETAIIEIDLALGIEYVFPTEDRPRLPFMRALYDEISGKVSRRDQNNWIFVALIQCAADFIEAFETSEYARASRAITYFIATCEYQFPPNTFYYPYVARIALRLAERDFDHAETLARALLVPEARTDDPWVALAVIAFNRGDFAQAAAHFDEALKLKQDAASLAGQMACRLLAGQEVNVEEALAAIRRVPCNAADVRQLDALKAFALLQRHRYAEADSLYRELSVNASLTVRQTENYAEVLNGLGRFDEALTLLREAITKAPSVLSLRQSLIAHLLRSGRQLEAKSELDSLVAREGLDRNLLGFAAQLLYGLGERDAARRIAARLLDINALGLPKTASDFYHCGAANWILNERDRADYDFERSGVDACSHYRTFLS